jgi:hypothetical protein
MESVKKCQVEQDIIFFFGAGASVDADVPDTYTFAIEFEEFIKNEHPKLAIQLRKIIEKREQFNKRSQFSEHVDVEQLLDTLRRLTNKEKEPLLQFYDQKEFCPDVDDISCSNLKKILESFIRERVTVRDPKRIEYLKELLKFDSPLEIYSTNYDTCIEQLSYLTHRRYTDGFNTDWNEENFQGNFDIKHYKLHGSVIWFENVQTKQTVKIPAQAVYQGKSVDLKLIYGEDIRPLLVYPAQKVEYIEPLTDLQLMFKHRLFNPETKFVVFVGYSFKDEYVARMLWDAARVNENLYIFVIAPNAQEIFETRLRYVNREKEDSSRIEDKVICLPYTFKAVLPVLRNAYLEKLRKALEFERELLNAEKKSEETDENWKILLTRFLEVEFSSKVEYILSEKLGRDWYDIGFKSEREQVVWSFKGYLHALMADEETLGEWRLRFNDSISFVSHENLHVSAGARAVKIELNTSRMPADSLSNLINELLNVFYDKDHLLSRQKTLEIDDNKNINRLHDLSRYLFQTSKQLSMSEYFEIRKDAQEKQEIEKLITNIQSRPRRTQEDLEKVYALEDHLKELITNIEKRELKGIYEGDVFQFSL